MKGVLSRTTNYVKKTVLWDKKSQKIYIVSENIKLAVKRPYNCITQDTNKSATQSVRDFHKFCAGKKTAQLN